MPIDTAQFHVPTQEQYDSQARNEEASFQAGIDQLQAYANDRLNHTGPEIEDAILTPQERAERDARLVLEEGIDTSFRPELFDEMNQEAHQETAAYHTQQREMVAQPQREAEPRAFTLEMAEQSIAAGTHLERAMQIAERLEYERDQLVLAA